jgi:hypothetical protein
LLTESLRQAMNSTANGWLLLLLNQTSTSHCQIQREKWTKRVGLLRTTTKWPHHQYLPKVGLLDALV